MATPSINRVNYCIKLGDHVGAEEAAEIMKAYDDKSQGQGSMCTYLASDGAILLECNTRNADECLSVLTELIYDHGAVQIECLGADADDNLDVMYDDFTVDAPMMTWQMVDDSSDDDQSIIEPSEGFAETWQPSNAQTNLLSLFKHYDKDLIEEIAKLTGCNLQPILERRQVFIEGEDAEMVLRAKDMLKVIERQSLLLGQSIAVYLVEVEPAPETQLRFLALNAIRNKVMQSSIVDHKLRFASDLYVLRIVRQEQETAPEFEWMKTSARYLAPFLRVTDRETQSLSKLWRGFQYAGKGEAKPTHKANGVASSSVNGNKAKQLDPAPKAVQPPSKDELQNGDHVNSSDLPSTSGIQADQKDTTVTEPETRAGPPPAAPEVPGRKKIRKARRPIILGSQQENNQDNPRPVAGDVKLETTEPKPESEESANQPVIPKKADRPTYVPPHLRGRKEKLTYTPPHRNGQKEKPAYIPPHLKVEEREPGYMPPHLRATEVDKLLGDLEATDSVATISDLAEDMDTMITGPTQCSQHPAPLDMVQDTHEDEILLDPANLPSPTQCSQQPSSIDIVQEDNILPDPINPPSPMQHCQQASSIDLIQEDKILPDLANLHSVTTRDVDHPQVQPEASLAASSEVEKVPDILREGNHVSETIAKKPVQELMEIPDTWVQEQLQSFSELEPALSSELIQMSNEIPTESGQNNVQKVEEVPDIMENLIQDWEESSEDLLLEDKPEKCVEIPKAEESLLIQTSDELIDTSEEDTAVKRGVIQTPDEASDQSLHEGIHNPRELPDAMMQEALIVTMEKVLISDDIPEATMQEPSQPPNDSPKEATCEGTQLTEAALEAVIPNLLQSSDYTSMDAVQETEKSKGLGETVTLDLLEFEQVPQAPRQDKTLTFDEVSKEPEEEEFKKSQDTLELRKQEQIDDAEEVPEVIAQDESQAIAECPKERKEEEEEEEVNKTEEIPELFTEEQIKDSEEFPGVVNQDENQTFGEAPKKLGEEMVKKSEATLKASEKEQLEESEALPGTVVQDETLTLNEVSEELKVEVEPTSIELVQETEKSNEAEVVTPELLELEQVLQATRQDETEALKEALREASKQSGVQESKENLELARQGQAQVSEEPLEVITQDESRTFDEASKELEEEAEEVNKSEETLQISKPKPNEDPEEAPEVITQRKARTIDEAAELSTQEKLQTWDEGETREYKRTMDQRKPASNGEESEEKISNLKKMHGAVLAMLELAKFHRGQVEVRVELGKILVGGLSKIQRPFPPEEWDSFFLEPNRLRAIFTKMLTTSATDADSILDMKTAQGRRFFKALPETKQVIYEIECSDSNGEEVMVQVDGTSFDYEIRKASRIFGSVFSFHPERSWDSRVCVEGINTTTQLADAVKELINSLLIAPNQTNISIVARAPDLRIRSVVSKLRTQHLMLPYRRRRRRQRRQSNSSTTSTNTSSSSSTQTQPQIVLQVTETRDLILQHHPTIKGGLRAFSTPAAQMISDAEGSRLWYEVDLIPLAAEQILKKNIDLPLAEEATWTPDMVVDEELMGSLYGLTKDVLEGMDDVGRIPKKRLGDKEREMLEREKEKETQARLEEEGKLIDVDENGGKKVDFW